MKAPIHSILIFLAMLHFGAYSQNNEKVSTRLGTVSFFSYTSVEDIEASNNQVYTAINKSNGEIAVRILMRAFVFKKALMEEHFNESYVESDLYPELRFSGFIQNFNANTSDNRAHIVKGTMDFHGVKKEIELKTNIENLNGNTILTGELEVPIKDFNIKVPALLAPNIAKIIQVTFRFEYEETL